MKFTITHMKAPWPAGASVGSVVEFEGDAAPAWAVGKCEPAADDAEVTHTFEAPKSVAGALPDGMGLDEFAAQAERAFEEMRKRHADEMALLQAQLDDAVGALNTARAQIGSLQAELAEAKTEDGKAAAALADADRQAAAEAKALQTPAKAKGAK